MDVSGEQQIDVDHNIFKQRLKLDGTPFPFEPEKEDLAKSSQKPAENVTVLCTLLYSGRANRGKPQNRLPSNHLLSQQGHSRSGGLCAWSD